LLQVMTPIPERLLLTHPLYLKLQHSTLGARIDMVAALFKAIDADGSGYLDMQEIELAAEKLGFPFESQDDLEAFFSRFDSRGDGRISEADFSAALAVLEAQDE